MIYDVSKSLHEGHGVAKSLYDEAVKVLSERGIVEIIGLCGYYTMVSMTLNTFEFESAGGRGFGIGVGCPASPLHVAGRDERNSL